MGRPVTAEVSQEVRDAIRGYVSLLPEAGQDALFVAAVAGSEFSLDVVSLVCDRPAEQVREALERGVARGILAGVAGEPRLYRFCDARHQAVLFEDLPPSRREWLEHQITQALQTLNESPP